MDVNKISFNVLLPTILSDINEACFISVDTEFTALLTSENFRRSYFDTGPQLYEKECRNLEDVSIIQMGISTFKIISDSNKYLVNTYNFFIRPHSLLCINDNILWQAANIEFLQLYNFNFQEWSINGIPCLNADNEEKIREFYGQILSGELNVAVPWKIRDKLLELKIWAMSSEVGDSKAVHLRSSTEILWFLAHLKSSAFNLVPSFENDKLSVTVTAYPDEEKVRIVAERALDIILDQMKGFVKVFEALGRADVPLILHNGLMDLMLIYKQFHRSLPETYREFKENVHKMFPKIYDTKQLASVVKRQLKIQKDKVSGPLNGRFLSETSLACIKADLERQMLVFHRPHLQHSSTATKYSNDAERFHEAGYDAFVTGYCFLHLSHIYASLCHFEKIEYQRPLSHRELVHAMKHWKNEIPVGGCSFEYMVLDGSDPKMPYYRWWVAKSRNVFVPLNPEFVVAYLSNFGGAQAVRFSKFSVLLAPNRSNKSNMLKAFSDHKHLRLTKYKHRSNIVGPLVWSWALLSTGLSTWFLVKSWRN